MLLLSPCAMRSMLSVALYLADLANVEQENQKSPQ
jgi:hypothetical protein